MENKENNPLDSLFRNGLESQESVPPSASWAQMEALLDAQVAQPKKRKLAVWYWAAAALVPFLVFSFLLIWNSNHTNQEVALSKSQPLEKIPTIKQTEIASNEVFKNQQNGDLMEVGEEKKGKKTMLKTTNPEIKSQSQLAFKPAEAERKRNETLNFPNPDLESEPIKKEIALVKFDEKFPPAIIEVEKGDFKDDNSEIASIEFRPAKAKIDSEDQVASVEWKKGGQTKSSFSEKIANIKSGQIKNFPTIGDAKEELFALLTFRK